MREGGAGLVTEVQLGGPGPVCKGWPVPGHGCLVDGSRLWFFGLNAERCALLVAHAGLPLAWLSLVSKAPRLCWRASDSG